MRNVTFVIFDLRESTRAGKFAFLSPSPIPLTPNSIFICIQGTGNLQSIIQFDVESLTSSDINFSK